MTRIREEEDLYSVLAMNKEGKNRQNETVLGESKPPTRPKSQPKVFRDSNPAFRIDLDLYLDVCWIVSKMLCIH